MGSTNALSIVCLPCVHQESTKESPFYLLYGRDPQLPTENILSQPRTAYMIDLDDYKSELADSLTYAWKLAQSNIEKAQQKCYPELADNTWVGQKRNCCHKRNRSTPRS